MVPSLGLKHHLRRLKQSDLRLDSSIEMIVTSSSRNWASSLETHKRFSLYVGSRYLTIAGEALLKLR